MQTFPIDQDNKPMSTEAMEELNWLVESASSRKGVFATWDSSFVVYVLPYLLSIYWEREKQLEPIAFEVP